MRARWSDPAAAEATARVASLELASGDLEAAATRPFDVAWRDERLHVAGLEAEGEGLRMRAGRDRAGLAPESPIEGRVAIEGDLASLPLPTAWSVSGAFAADAALSGTRLRAARRRCRRRDGRAGHERERRAARSRSRPAAWTSRATACASTTSQAEVPGGTLTLQADAPFAALLPTPPGAAPSERARDRDRRSSTDVDAGALASALRDLDVSVDGTLSARLEVEARPATREIRGTLEAPASTLRVGDVLVELGALRARADGCRIVLEPWTIGSRGGEIVTQATVDAKSRGRSTSTSRGRIDLRALSPLLEQAALTGQADDRRRRGRHPRRRRRRRAASRSRTARCGCARSRRPSRASTRGRCSRARSSASSTRRPSGAAARSRCRAPRASPPGARST